MDCSIEMGRKVFDTEIEALVQMRNHLDSTFEEIVSLISDCDGKVILTGMGKPGHVAAKIAATFSSLGTPAFYLHPAEAMHGDLGMVSANDIVIAISYSGESDEVISILPGIKFIGAKIIAITKNANSTLAQYADVVQELPSFEEACNLGLAPTSSTTVELCYGDALAIAISRRYGFGEQDFGRLHPAGALGKKLLYKVSDIMSVGDDVPKVRDDAMLEEAIEELTRGRLSIVSIVDECDRLKGILTDADLRRLIKAHADIYSILIRDVMNLTPFVFHADDLAVEALDYMRKKSCNVLPIIDSEMKLIGTIHMQQIVRAGIVI